MPRFYSGAALPISCAVDSYRRIEGKGGTWTARAYDPATRRREYRALGAADDFMDADGVECLTFAQAQEAARAWFASLARRRAGQDEEPEPPATVAQAVEEYLADYRRRGGRALRELQTTFGAHVLPTLGHLRLDALTARRLNEWRDALADAPARVRTRPGDAQRSRKAGDDPDAQRARRSTANNVLGVLKAALNHAFRQGRVASDVAWRRVRPFQRVAAARVRWLRDDEALRLANACAGDLRTLVTGALLTGCRYGELAAMTAGDFDPSAATVHVARSKGGKARHVALTDEGVAFFQQLAAGRAAGERLFLRWSPEAERMSPWGKSQQFRPLRDACTAAAITPAISFHILRHTYGSRLARAGVPMQVIAAQLGHADTRITERHYAHLAPDHVAGVVRQSFAPLNIAPASDAIITAPS